MSGGDGHNPCGLGVLYRLFTLRFLCPIKLVYVNHLVLVIYMRMMVFDGIEVEGIGVSLGRFGSSFCLWVSSYLGLCLGLSLG